MRKQDIKIYCNKSHLCIYVDKRILLLKQKYINYYEKDGSEIWCDLCDINIKQLWFYHCSLCIYDVCQKCAKNTLNHVT